MPRPGPGGSTRSAFDQLRARRRRSTRSSSRRWASPASTSGRGSTRRPASVRSRYFATDFGIAEDEATGRGRGDAWAASCSAAAHDPPGRRLGDPRPAAARRHGRDRRPGRAGRDARRVRAGSVACGREWDAIVVGLGGIGSGAAYWLSRAARRPGPRPRAVRARPPQRRVGQDHSRIIRLSYHRPDYVRLARRAYATWAEVEARGRRRRSSRSPAASTSRRATPRSRWRTTRRAMDRRGRPVRAPRRAPRSCGAGRSGAWATSTTACTRRTSGLADPNRGNAAHQRLAREQRRDAPRPLPGDAAARRRRRGRGHDGRRHGPPRGDGRPRRRRLDERAAARLRPAAAADDHQGAGDVLRLPGSGGVRARTASRSGSGWTTRASTASRPTARPGRRPPRTSAATRRRPRRGRSTATRRPTPASSRFLAEHLPGRRRAADLHEDVPLHADAGPRLRRRPAARRAARPRRAGRGARLQVRLGPRPASSRSSPSTGRPRPRARSSASAIDRPILLEESPVTSFMV